jgi:eukaryotic-like serine/threonine-protein kinase
MTQETQIPELPSGGNGKEPAPDLTLRTIGDFRIIRKLGQGGFGEVYLAEQVSLKRPVALKILRPEVSADEGARSRFETEATAAAKAVHANIVQVYTFGVVDGMACIAMEYVEGRNLREYLARKGPPELLVALSIMRQVAMALQRAGELGIIHRDIKPENILLTRKVEVKVADFGLARYAQGVGPALNVTASGVSMGTPLYMSPEQVEGKAVDPRTDIYSFGVTCYHMLAGVPPYQGDSPFEVALQHVRGTPRPLAEVRPDLPEALCTVVHKMMARDPGARYQTGRELLRDILRVRESVSGPSGTFTTPVTISVEPVPTVAPILPPPEPQPVRSGQWRRSLLMALMLLCLPLAASGGALYAWAKRSQPLPPLVPAVTAADTVSQPSRCDEPRKVANVDEYLSGDKNTNHIVGVGLCCDLALIYLESHRLEEAQQLFTRMMKKGRPYEPVGHLGLAIVAALRDDPELSRLQFFRAFPLAPVGKGSKSKGPERPTPERTIPGPINQLLSNAKWRFWVTRALYYNAKNGVKDEQVPAPLRPYLPGRKS